MATKFKIQKFRANDLSKDTGKQFELGKVWCVDFLEIPNTENEVVINLFFKSITENQRPLDGTLIELKLSPPTSRADRKAYADGDSSHSQIKDFFINALSLSDSNKEDYFAIYKSNDGTWFLYVIPKMVYDNFVKLFTENTVFDSKEINDSKEKKTYALQQIYYGAPGTGKSNTIKGLTNEDNSIRITFHPDSDYASFVGCYKPTVENVKTRAYKDFEDLKEEAKTINESQDEKVVQIIAFVTKYADDLLHIVETQSEVKSLQNLLKVHLGFNADTYLAHVVNYVLKNQKKEITYKFCPQAFTNAYVEAWKDTSKPYYLVIEEINRGNCAQIFGDIFQLLDRGDDGSSSYEITPDTDLQQYLAEAFENVEIVDTDIKTGKKMRLPSNLYILATMNTSDQSLFPIDSAFKRRWDWKYIPIKNEGKNYKIVVDKAKYDWWKFIEIVNKRIEDVTDSEDKQIGYWFAKANGNGEISAETMVSKVLFYLWNDVFKDYAHSQSSLFHTEKRKYKFREFYNDNGNVRLDLLNEFLVELKLVNETPKTEETQSGEE